MSNDELVARISREFELTLKDKFGAHGHGLSQMAESVKGKLTFRLYKDLSDVARIRNQVLHKGQEIRLGVIRSSDDFQAYANEIKSALDQLVAFSLTATSQIQNPVASVEFEDVSIDYGVDTVNGLGISINVKCSVNNVADKRCRLMAHFYSADGEALLSRDESYGSASGQLAVGQEFTPPYVNSKYDQPFRLQVPYSALSLVSGRNDFRIYVWVYNDSQNIAIGGSWYNFALDAS